jgi:hypothetical protein
LEPCTHRPSRQGSEFGLKYFYFLLRTIFSFNFI